MSIEQSMWGRLMNHLSQTDHERGQWNPEETAGNRPTEGEMPDSKLSVESQMGLQQTAIPMGDRDLSQKQQ